MTEVEIVSPEGGDVTLVEVGGNLTGDAAVDVTQSVVELIEVDAGAVEIELLATGEVTDVAGPAEIEVPEPAQPVVTLGQQGPPGPPGPPGPAGEGGGPGGEPATAFYHVHTQMAPAAEWHIVHNLGGRPAVTVADSAGAVVIGDVRYLGDDELVVTFTHPFGGFAYLS